MKAVVAKAYGPPEQFEVASVPTPRAGPGQMQVRVAAAALNPVDLKVAAGEIVELPFPHVLGNDFAGAIPNSYQIVREAIDRGVPLDEVKPGNRITTELKRLIQPQVVARPQSASLAQKLSLSWAKS